MYIIFEIAQLSLVVLVVFIVSQDLFDGSSKF